VNPRRDGRTVGALPRKERRAPAGAPRPLLAPIYGWFTDGFDTPDLTDSKALLDELG
jgi:hypothetical protein